MNFKPKILKKKNYFYINIDIKKFNPSKLPETTYKIKEELLI